ncbi:tubulin epsilon chain, putative [Babesia caballi]|uniref:Tubulin epsilon chain, putative n=1 Tax=Babesia caballi TaxID=5871 RepID=A0AAV4LS37_BABCB|nr:tubulin epsilon chain, putative [Babesia caballi]
MKEILSINLGQCGIQVASCFWEMLSDGITTKSENRFSDPEQVQSYFYNSSDETHQEGSLAAGLPGDIRGVRARCILVDSDLGTISEILQRQQLSLIDSSNIICGTEATGNNWSTAYCSYGPQYRSAMEELLRKTLETCDESFQYFSLTFGIAGGTGSGLGSYMLDVLSDEYGKVHRICNVVTQCSMAAVSPYNTLFCLQHLNDTSTISNFFSNEALLQQSLHSTAQILRHTKKNETRKESGFNQENALISSFLKGFGMATVSRRYPGFNMSSVVNTLTPLPGLNFTCPYMVPNHFIQEGATTEALTNELLKPANRISPIPLKERSLPMAMAIHGGFDTSSLKHIKRLKLRHNMVGWMRDAVKISLTGAFAKDAPAESRKGMYGIANDCSIYHFLKSSLSNFDCLYSKKAFLHHFSDALEEGDFSLARERVNALCSDYEEIAKFTIPPHHLFDEASAGSLGLQLKKVSDEQCCDVWNNVPGLITSDKRHWWDLNGTPLL